MKKAATVAVPLHYGFRNGPENSDGNQALFNTRSAFVYKVSVQCKISLFAYWWFVGQNARSRTGVMQHPAIHRSSGSRGVVQEQPGF